MGEMQMNHDTTGMIWNYWGKAGSLPEKCILAYSPDKSLLCRYGSSNSLVFVMYMGFTVRMRGLGSTNINMKNPISNDITKMVTNSLGTFYVGMRNTDQLIIFQPLALLTGKMALLSM